MTGHRTAPPPSAEWLVSLVAGPEQTATMLGDLHEEFSEVVSQSGLATARRWYWRQSVSTITHLIAGQVRHAPRETVAFAVAGFALYIFADRALQMSAEALGSHTRIYFYLSAVPYWTVITAAERLVVPTIVGWAVARAARGREVMVALSGATILTIWILAFYANWLLATAGLMPIYVPDFSMTPMFYSVHAAGPHPDSLWNTLMHLQLTLIYWWIPTVVMLVVGAVLRRAFAVRQTLRNQTA